MRSNIYLIKISEGEKRENDGENTLSENFPDLIKNSERENNSSQTTKCF